MYLRGTNKDTLAEIRDIAGHKNHNANRARIPAIHTELSFGLSTVGPNRTLPINKSVVSPYQMNKRGRYPLILIHPT